ncbi:uncharacterized protein LOC126965441 [Leptidea sinapis]|uniref:uncharacterized protein LOC126965441 n=1 Tax=Leptidea sinapis TaxID=189913 RepID=UPI00213E221A|nr:uncharacterized protein LOC126965441 [Leptidea sinapis]XP_050665018.1 uncharacterized protein LOC126965441 [Leptidea sinapis]
MNQERLQKLREDRKAKEMARIQMLRELNLKKYSTPANTTNMSRPAGKTDRAVRNSMKTVKNNSQHKTTLAKPSSSKTINKLSLCDDKSVKTTETKRRETVFERLYKPKVVKEPIIEREDRIRHDEIVNNPNLNTNRRKTTVDIKPFKMPVRRSISAIHFKNSRNNELGNSLHKFSSVSENINTVSLKEVDEVEPLNGMISAVKCEQKKVTFQTPIHNAKEMCSKLHRWLEKMGKSIDSYPHLQCFMDQDTLVFNVYADENKENEALEHDSDNESYTELNGDGNKDDAMNKWREPSYISESGDIESSPNTTLTSGLTPRLDDLLLGALNDLTELLRNGYNWDECARWLRAVRNRFPMAQERAEYWECRAALEEGRGDISASVQCWEHAISKGAERSVAEANLDQLLDKFMQLKINPNSCKKTPLEPKLVDAKNVFKSTIIRFAVKESKKSQTDGPSKMTLTPVRRSSRLSCNRFTPKLKLFSSVQKASEMGNTHFIPNRAIPGTP